MLRSDSGDNELDLKMRGYQKVLVGYAQYRMVRCSVSGANDISTEWTIA